MSDSILILEPSGVLRDYLSGIVERCGFTPKLAQNAAGALERLEEDESICLVFMDWYLPDAKGIDFMKKLKANSKTSNIPIVFVTTESDKGCVVTALKSGAADYIIKPYSPKQIGDRIKRFALQNQT